MKLGLSYRLCLWVGVGLLIAACSNEDNIADSPDAGTGGAAGTGGVAGSGGGVAGTGGEAVGGSSGSGGQQPDGGGCENACPGEGSTLCMGNRNIACKTSVSGCLAWQAGDYCAQGQTCNADATSCIVPSSSCSADSECGCGCACVSGECRCTGAIPPSCDTDADCGPACYGLACVSGACVQRTDVTCIDPCPYPGATRCMGNAEQTCELKTPGCLQWGAPSACPQDHVCNSSGTQCIAHTDQCSANDDCGCGCGCVAGECKCTGAIPPSCNSDADCGPACSGLVCVSNECVQAGGCVDTCEKEGATRCVGTEILTCIQGASGCLLWGNGTSCPAGQVCNSSANQCVPDSNSCSSDGDCGCMCFCHSGQCYCTGAIPPTCDSDADCGPACAGFVCMAGKCVQL